MSLVIYLDTQDYITLFNEPPDGPNHQVLATLLRFRDRGDITIGFSVFTILEFITRPNAAHREERTRRGALVKKICGPNAFPSLPELGKGATFPNGGQWLFAKDFKVMTAKQFRLQIRKTLMAELPKHGLNRKLRRQLARKGALAELLRLSGSGFGRKRSDYGGIPVSDELIASRIFERFIKGRCSDTEFERRMNAWATDPEEYSRLIYDYADQPNALDAYFGKAIDEIENSITAVRKSMADIREANKSMANKRKPLVEEGMGRRKARALTKQLTQPDQELEKITTKLEEIIGTGRAGHFAHYLRHMLRSDQPFKRSDVMDLMQLSYAYDCDLLRCDKAMASIFANFKPLRGKLVGRFRDLPPRICRLL